MCRMHPATAFSRFCSIELGCGQGGSPCCPMPAPPVSSPCPLPVCPLYLSRSVAVTWSLCLPVLFAYHVFIITITAPKPIIRVSAGVILRSRSGAGERNLIFSRRLKKLAPPLCNEKPFSLSRAANFFEQSKGVGGHFSHICYTHMYTFYIWRHSTELFCP